jgi:hypothetical protein
MWKNVLFFQLDFSKVGIHDQLTMMRILEDELHIEQELG